MRIMLDTNVLISMILFPREQFSQMLDYITHNHTLVLSSFIIEEMEAVVERKFPSKKDCLMRFLSSLNYELILTPHKLKPNLFEIRDPNDYPVLYSAIIGSIDIFLTGDKDFKNISIEKPEILSPSDFVLKYLSTIF